MTDSLQATSDEIQRLLTQGQFDAALPLGKRLVERAPHLAASWFMLGQVQLLRVELPMAESCFQQATQLEPANALFWTNLSIVVLGQGRALDAEKAARRAVELDATTDMVWINLGSALFHLQRWTDAAAAYREALSRAPNNAVAWSNLASAELKLERLNEAQAALERSLSIAPNPDNAVLYAMLLIRREHLQQAAYVLKQVVAQVPDLESAWMAWGEVQTLLGEPVEAETAFRRVISLEPKNRQAQLKLAGTLLTQFHLQEAEQVSRNLIQAEPTNAEAWATLAAIQQAAAKVPDALKAFQRSVELSPDHTRHSRWLAAMQYGANVTAEGLLTAHRQWDQQHGQVASVTTRGKASEAAGGPLRIGFVSANFNRHPIAFLALPMLEAIDRTRATVILYSDRFDEDLFTARFKATADMWHGVGRLTDDEMAALIRRDEVDILIDLMGHTGRRLPVFARKPAPVQATWLGYAGTTGLSAIDYIIADRHHIRPGEEGWYQESVLRLPHSYAVYGPPDYLPEVNRLPAKGQGTFTFGSLSNPAKFTPQLLQAWARILKRTDNTRLLLQFAGLGEEAIQWPIRQQLAAVGIAPDRILFKGTVPHPDLLAAYHEVDLALDTQPYSGGVTTCEALWMGVPVVTCPGNTFAGRHSTSYLSSASLPEFVTPNLSAYVEFAVSWTKRLSELSDLRDSLRSRVAASPIGNAKQFAHDFVEMLQQAKIARPT
jgi:protein O-GlcNAc transferase